MGLTALLLRVAAKRPHVLVVAVPGATAVRLALEAALVQRGWPVATGPADADVLAVAGSPGPELAEVIAAVWEQVPAPRARIEVSAPTDVDERLDAAAAVLADVDHQRSSPAVHAPGGTERHGGRAGHADHRVHGGHAEHGGTGEHSEHAEHGGHSADHDDRSDHGGEAADDHAGRGGGHNGHRGHHGHGGGMVAGLAMAELGADRDGLTLDRLHVPLGPVLPDWPAGLVVRVVLQGDVIQEASAEVLDVGQGRPFEWPSAAARELDGLARFLGVAGWPSPAGRARRLRDAVLAGAPGDQIAAEAAGLLRRVRRSRTLRWLIRDIPVGATDVAALLAARLAALEAGLLADPRPGVAELTHAAPEPQHGGHTPVEPEYGHHAVAELAGLLVGAELAAARLIVAAVDPDTDRVVAGKAAPHG
jgi:hypothetical protein